MLSQRHERIGGVGRIDASGSRLPASDRKVARSLQDVLKSTHAPYKPS